MKICIHQPEFCSYLGFYDKISKADALVIADSFQVKKNYFDNRNKIRTSQDWQWITIPIEQDNHKSFREVRIMNEHNWRTKMLNAIRQNYSKAPYFNEYYPRIEEIICQKHYFLFDYNYDFICQIMSWLNIGTPHIAFTSSLNLQSDNGSDKCLEICQKLMATSYLSGKSGEDYLNVDKFNKLGIQVEFHEFEHPVYEQVYYPFIPGMSILDYLMNCGGILWTKSV